MTPHIYGGFTAIASYTPFFAPKCAPIPVSKPLTIHQCCSRALLPHWCAPTVSGGTQDFRRQGLYRSASCHLQPEEAV